MTSLLTAVKPQHIHTQAWPLSGLAWHYPTQNCCFLIPGLTFIWAGMTYPELLFSYSRLDLYLGWHDITLPRTVVFLFQAWPLSGRAWHYPTQNCCFLIPGLTFIWTGMTLPYPELLFSYSRIDLYLGWHDITLPRTVVFLFQDWPLFGLTWHYPTQNCCFLIPSLTFIWTGMTLPYPELLFSYSRLDLYLGWHDITLPRTVVFLFQAWPLSGQAWHYPIQNCCFLIPG